MENLDASLKNYFDIVVFLIENGAFYEKIMVEGGGEFFVSKKIKDVSKTNFFYKLAKEHTRIR